MSAQVLDFPDRGRARRQAVRRAAEPTDAAWADASLMLNPFALAWLEGFLGVRKPTTIILTEDPA